MPVSPSLQVNGKPVRKEESKTASPGGGNEKSAAKSSSTAKPTPGNSEELQTLHHQLLTLLLFVLLTLPTTLSWLSFDLGKTLNISKLYYKTLLTFEGNCGLKAMYEVRINSTLDALHVLSRDK